jgi:hypothetical protein
MFFEPLAGEGAPFFPVRSGVRTSASASVGVEGGEAGFLSGLEDIPTGVAVGGAVGARGGKVPRLGILWGPSNDGFSEFRAASAFWAEDEADDCFEDDPVFAAGAFKLAPCITVARRGETEVAAEVEEVVLGFDGFVVSARRREWRAEDVFIVDEEDGRAARAEEDAVFSGGKVHFCKSAEQERIVSRGPHAGFDVLVGNSE